MSIIGWREWVSLPDFGPVITKAKVDTGARTSALHAYYVEPFTKAGMPWVRFGLHPLQGDLDTAVDCEAPVVGRRQVTDCGGHRGMRYVSTSAVQRGGTRCNTESTLTDRETMRFRMLLGRTDRKTRVLVNCNGSFMPGVNASHPRE